MSVTDLSSWRRELLDTGQLVQDEDRSVAAGDAEQRFNRYVELVAAPDGTEGPEAALTLVQSIQALHDYGAYEGTVNALLFLFPTEQSAAAIVSELPRLITSLPEWAGELLSSLTRAGESSRALVLAFNTAFASAGVVDREQIVAFIRQEEIGGWLEGKHGVLGGVGL